MPIYSNKLALESLVTNYLRDLNYDVGYEQLKHKHILTYLRNNITCETIPNYFRDPKYKDEFIEGLHELLRNDLTVFHPLYIKYRFGFSKIINILVLKNPDAYIYKVDGCDDNPKILTKKPTLTLFNRIRCNFDENNYWLMYCSISPDGQVTLINQNDIKDEEIKIIESNLNTKIFSFFNEKYKSEIDSYIRTRGIVLNNYLDEVREIFLE